MTTSLVEVALSLGSNVQRYHHINAGLWALESNFGQVLSSPVYESAAVGFDGNPFLNLVAVVQTQHSLDSVIQRLKQIEDANGRVRSGPRFSSRTLDIDVVTYGNCYGVVDGVELPRPELFKNAFVLLPMADLWPNRCVPGQSKTYSELWQALSHEGQQLHQVPFERRY